MGLFIGYDGQPYGVGDRVELHPCMDPWMQGARFGTVKGQGPEHRVRVTLDKRPGRPVDGYPDTFRRIP